MARLPDLYRIVEPGNIINRLRDLERSVRRLEVRQSAGLDVPEHTHDASDLTLVDDSSCPAQVTLDQDPGTSSYLARRDHAHQLDTSISPSWSGSHVFTSAPSMAGLAASGHEVVDVGWPSSASAAVNKSYADSRLGGRPLSPSAPGSDQILIWNESASEWQPGDQATFLDLSDSPSSYSGYSGALTVVAKDESALIFADYYPFPDAPPSASHSMDDEFDDGSLDAKWTSASNGTGTASPVEAGGLLTVSMPTSDLDWALTQPAPAGSFSACARLASDRVHSNYQSVGLAVWTGSVGSSEFYRLALTAKSSSGMEMSVQRWNGWTWAADYYTNGYHWPQSLYARFRFDPSASHLYMGWSGDGVSWLEYRVSGIGSLDHVGLFITCDGTPSWIWQAKVFYFRVSQS